MATVVDVRQVVAIGSTVRIVVDGDEEEWTVVQPYDSDWSSRRLSAEVPLGRALLGHAPGESVLVRGPRGPYRAGIVDVR